MHRQRENRETEIERGEVPFFYLTDEYRNDLGLPV